MIITFDRLDSAGIADMLKGEEIRAAISGLARQVAGNLNVDADVRVEDYTTDRAASAVTIEHPRALDWQIRDGVLTRAASAAGLEVRTKR